ncbi:hypothetical protein [Gorillibacterium sp. sgz5001074]|uniref:hypothetical protein n=1 Tax=Gorillibacterium sp. sgz5001074 TaxID=3446695 RepID=UPI003F67CF01
MSGYAIPRINIRSRGFSWDDDDLIAGEQPETDFSDVWYFFIENGIVLNVVLGGWRLMDWWYHGGWVWMRILFEEYAGWLLQMIDLGTW